MNWRLALSLMMIFGACYVVYYFSLPTNPQHIDYWPEFEGLDIQDKIRPYPLYRKIIHVENNMGENVPLKPYHADESQLERIREALSNIPKHIIDIINPHLAGIFLVDNLNSTGLAHYVFDEKGSPTVFVILLNGHLIQKNTNEWINFKVKSVFSNRYGEKINIVMDDPGASRVYELILLHEFGHLFSYIKNIVPIDYHFNTSHQSYEFINKSWDYNGYGLARHFENNKLFSGIEFYSDHPYKKFSDDPMVLYEHLWRTNFTTLYSTYDYQEDFAEAFLLYFWCVEIGKPYTVKVLHEGKWKTYDIKKKFLSSQKFKFMDKLFSTK